VERSASVGRSGSGSRCSPRRDLGCAIRSSEKLSLAGLFVLLASVVVWAPAAVYLGARTSGVERLMRAQEWMTYRRPLTFSPLLLFGGVLIVHRLAGLRESEGRLGSSVAT